MTLYSVMGLISTVALITPVVAILSLRLTIYKTFPLLLVYYIFSFAYNFTLLNYLDTGKMLLHTFDIIAMIVNIPILLFFLTYLCSDFSQRKKLLGLTIIYVTYEIVILLLKGYTTFSTALILGPGLILVVTYSALFFIHRTKIAIMYMKAFGKSLISAAILFSYGCYCIIYIILYWIKTKDIADTMLIYFMVTTISSVALAIGLVIESRRIKKLNELKITRDELKTIYGKVEPKKTAPLKAVSINRDLFF